MADRFTIDADFPGGNIVIDTVDGNDVRLRPDLRTTTPWWFYWCFRIRLPASGAMGGQTLRIALSDKRLIGPKGPCHSLDAGQTWSWLGSENIDGDTFSFTLPKSPAATDIRFSVSFPYVSSHLDAFCQARPQIRRETLDWSERGRKIELLTLPSQHGTYVVPLTARLHACETMGNYALEGILDAWLNNPSDEGDFLREHVDLRAFPLFDIDGVEAGDQGKQRAPHDHNRDFIDSPIYVATRAFKRELPGWRGKPALALDLHCPWITGGRNDELFLVGAPEPWSGRESRFTHILEDLQRGELRYDRAHTIASGVEWNIGTLPTLSRYVRENTPVQFAASFEIPYAIAGGQTMTPDNTRQFGGDMARAIARFILESGPT